MTPEAGAAWEGRWFDAAAIPAPELCSWYTCEAMDLAVEVPEGYWESRDGGLEVSIRWGSEQNDFELYVYDGDGALVAASAGGFSTAESVLVPEPESGRYRVVAMPLAVVASGYSAIAELEVREPPAGEARDLLPNLRTLPPFDLKLVAPVGYATGAELPVAAASCNPDETVDARAVRCLRFSNAILNDGAGALELRFRMEGAVDGLVDAGKRAMVQRVFRSDGTFHDVRAGNFEVHPIHAHVHYEGFAQYFVHAVAEDGARGPVVRQSEKSGFCAIDVALEWWAAQGNEPRRYTFPACNLPHESDNAGTWMVMGISRGWSDVYTWDLPDQYVEISDLPDGVYDLVAVADPFGTLVEESRADNAGATRFRLAGNEVTVLGPA